MKNGAVEVVVFAVALGLATSGCDLIKKVQKAREDVAEAASTGTKKNPSKGADSTAVDSKAGDKAAKSGQGDAADPDDALGEKLNHPIECINHASERVSRSRNRYLQWVKDPKVGPTGTEQNVYGTFEIEDFFASKCKSELKDFLAMKDPPTPDLDKAATAYAAALDAVVPLVNEANKYYDKKNYEDDKFKKAKEMHPALMKALDDFEAADDALHTEVSKLKTGLSERELVKIEKRDGKKLVWHAKKLMMVAKKVLEVGAMEDSKVDIAKLDAAVKDLETITDDTETYATQHADESGGLHMFTFAESPMKDFLKAAKALFRRLRDKKPFDEGDQMSIDHGFAETVDGHQAKLLKDYNSLVEGMNNTHL